MRIEEKKKPKTACCHHNKTLLIPKMRKNYVANIVWEVETIKVGKAEQKVLIEFKKENFQQHLIIVAEQIQ